MRWRVRIENLVVVIGFFKNVDREEQSLDSGLKVEVDLRGINLN